MTNLKQAVMQVMEITESEAIEEIKEAREEIMELIGEGEMPFDYCEERWGLEPDYLEDLIL